MTSYLYRQLILPIILACLLAACGSKEPQEPSVSSPMKFSVELGSRSVLVGTDNIKAHTFAVYSDMMRMEPAAEPKFISIHNGTQVSFNASIGEWSYDNLQYWFPGYQYSFVAVSPAGNPWLSNLDYSDNNLKFTYDQPTQYSSASDLLIAAHRRNYSGGETDAVRFGFSHILTNVNVKVSYKGFSSGPQSIKIDELTFRNIPVKSSYSIKPAPLSGKGTMTSDWENAQGSQSGWTLNDRGEFKITFPSDAPRVVPANNEAVRLFNDSDALLLLPNPDDPTERAEVEMTYTTDTGQTETVSGVINSGWNPGTNVTLSFDLNNALVQFSVTVEDWKDGSETNTTVPRK